MTRAIESMLGLDVYLPLIRDVRDFPRPGVLFKDITPLLANGEGFNAAVQAMCLPWRNVPLDAVVGVESRGFIFAAAMALELKLGFVPIRKPGKLPSRTVGADYALEYGHDRIEMHADAVAAGARVLLVDDVLATGGTLEAAVRLLRAIDADLVGAQVLLELPALGGRQRLHGLPLTAVLSY